MVHKVDRKLMPSELGKGCRVQPAEKTRTFKGRTIDKRCYVLNYILNWIEQDEKSDLNIRRVKLVQ